MIELLKSNPPQIIWNPSLPIKLSAIFKMDKIQLFSSKYFKEIAPFIPIWFFWVSPLFDIFKWVIVDEFNKDLKRFEAPSDWILFEERSRDNKEDDLDKEFEIISILSFPKLLKDKFKMTNFEEIIIIFDIISAEHMLNPDYVKLTFLNISFLSLVIQYCTNLFSRENTGPRLISLHLATYNEENNELISRTFSSFNLGIDLSRDIVEENFVEIELSSKRFLKVFGFEFSNKLSVFKSKAILLSKLEFSWWYLIFEVDIFFLKIWLGVIVLNMLKFKFKFKLSISINCSL